MTKIPAHIQYAKKLIKEAADTKATSLDLGYCGLTDLEKEVPELFELEWLEELVLGNEYWDGEKWIKERNAGVRNTFKHLPTGLEELKNLKHLVLSDLGLDADAAVQLAALELPQLTELNLWSNQIGEKGAEAIAKLSKLSSLNLSENQIGIKGAEAIAKLSKLTLLFLGGNKIGDQGAEAIANLSQLTSLNLSHNQIGDKGAEAIAKLSKLTSLNLAGNIFGKGNQIGDKGAEAIAKLSKLNQLDLWGNQIGDKGAEAISNLSNLTSLYLGGNQIGDKGAEAISKLSKLTSLDLKRNQIGEKGAEAIAKLSKLTSLNLWENKIGDKGAEAIAKLSNLTSLDLWNNQIGEKGAEAIAKLSNLTTLNLGSNQIGENGAEAIAKLSNLTSLDLSENEIGDNGASAITRLSHLTTLNILGNEIGDNGFAAIVKIKSLTTLIIGGNEIGDYGVSYVARLPQLTFLDIRWCNIADSGATAIAELSQLTSLDIEGNQIGDKGAKAISRMSQLTSLSLEDNQIGDEGAEALVKNLPQLETLYLGGNNTQKIPREILNDVEALRSYFGVNFGDNIEIKFVPNDVVKMILLGNTTAGKTALASFLIERKFSEDKDSTHGVQYWRWETKHKSKDVFVNIWDFGGQDYYHATHNLFLDHQSLFLLLHANQEVHEMDCNEAEQFHTPAYWMGNIYDMTGRLRQEIPEPNSEESPKEKSQELAVWFVQNKSDHAKFKQEWLQSEYHAERQFHISIKEAFKDEEEPPLAWEMFKKSLSQRLAELAKTEIPEYWAHIQKEALPKWKEESRVFIEQSEFIKRCKEALKKTNIGHPENEGDYYGLLKYLKGTGEIVWFNDKSNLKDKIFLGSDILTQHLFKNVLSKYVRDNGGKFSLKSIPQKNREASAFIEILKEYELIFEDPDKLEHFVAPQFLPEDPHINRFMQIIPLSFALRFPVYMPRHFITRCITHYAQRDKEAHYWRYGVFFKNTNGIHCLIRIDAHKQIVYVHTEDKKERFEALREVFDFFTRSCYDKPVEADGTPDGMQMPSGKIVKGRINEENVDLSHIDGLELSTDGQNFIRVSTIKEGVKGRAQKVRAENGNYVELSSTLFYLAARDAKPPKRIFVCYSHLDKEPVQELLMHMRGPEMSGLVDMWFDGKIEAGKDWDETIKNQLKSSDIVLAMLSHGFMASRYIWETELPLAKRNGATIVPVFLSPVYYKENVQKLYTRQGFPRGEKFILSSAWSYKHEAYKNVVEEMVKLIEDKSDLKILGEDE